MKQGLTPFHKLPRGHIEHALLLIARIHSGDDKTAASAHQALEHWRISDPAHEAALQAAQACWDATNAQTLRSDIICPPSAADRQRKSRRAAMSMLGIGAMLLAAGSLARWQWQQPVYQLTLETPRGQSQTVTLPDGTQLELDARTRAQVIYHRNRREVRLDSGEIRFSVRSDASRPFGVATDWGQAEVLGTVFTVEARHQRMRVAVAEGRVAVWAGPRTELAARGPAQAVLSAGQMADAFNGALSPVQQVASSDVGAWRKGWLVFDNTPLSEVVARWNDYLATPLRLANDPALARLRLTGSFPLRAPDAFVGSLPGSLPVRIEKSVNGSISILARR